MTAPKLAAKPGSIKPPQPAGELMRQGVYTAIGAGLVTLGAVTLWALLQKRQKSTSAAPTAPAGCGCGCGGK